MCPPRNRTDNKGLLMANFGHFLKPCRVSVQKQVRLAADHACNRQMVAAICQHGLARDMAGALAAKEGDDL